MRAPSGPAPPAGLGIMNRCRVCAADLARIERLAARVRAQAGASIAIPRAALLRALLKSGLDLAETREITGDCLSRAEASAIVEFRITALDLDRLTRLRDVLHAQRPLSAVPALSSLERALILLALSESEAKATFSAFCRSVLLLRLRRGNGGQRSAIEQAR